MMKAHEDKRKHPRFRAADNALAAWGMESCALLDVSAGGLGVQHYGENPFPREVSVDLLFLYNPVLPGVRACKQKKGQSEKQYALSHDSGPYLLITFRVSLN